MRSCRSAGADSSIGCTSSCPKPYRRLRMFGASDPNTYSPACPFVTYSHSAPRSQPDRSVVACINSLRTLSSSENAPSPCQLAQRSTASSDMQVGWTRWNTAQLAANLKCSDAFKTARPEADVMQTAALTCESTFKHVKCAISRNAA